MMLPPTMIFHYSLMGIREITGFAISLSHYLKILSPNAKSRNATCTFSIAAQNGKPQWQKRAVDEDVIAGDILLLAQKPVTYYVDDQHSLYLLMPIGRRGDAFHRACPPSGNVPPTKFGTP